MSEPSSSDPAASVPRRRFERQEPEIDWIAAERSPEFRELIAKKRRFVVPATIFFLSWYLGFIALAGYAPDFMGESIYEGFTVGYALALTQFVMVWGLGWMYIRKADKEFDPLAEKAAQVAFQAGSDKQKGSGNGGNGAGTESTRQEVTRS
jgi:uncharacterized membrane protein (DUF485 family)